MATPSQAAVPTFEDLGLHDATLRTIELDWKGKICRVLVRTNEGTRQIEFSEVTDINVPHHESWGPSVSIMATRSSVGAFEIQMQSGDVILIKAGGFRLVAI